MGQVIDYIREELSQTEDGQLCLTMHHMPAITEDYGFIVDINTKDALSAWDEWLNQVKPAKGLWGLSLKLYSWFKTGKWPLRVYRINWDQNLSGH